MVYRGTVAAEQMCFDSFACPLDYNVGADIMATMVYSSRSARALCKAALRGVGRLGHRSTSVLTSMHALAVATYDYAEMFNINIISGLASPSCIAPKAFKVGMHRYQ